MIPGDPMDTTPQDLLAQLEDSYGRRLNALEAENRRIRRNGRYLGLGLAAALGGIVVLFVVAGQMLATGAREVVSAKQFVLKDDRGAVRGVWTVEQDGATRLVLNDRDESPRLRLGVVEGGAPGLAFVDGSAQSRVVLGLLPDETSNLVFADRAGRARAVFGLSRDNASLVFADQNGATRAGIGVDGTGNPSFTLHDDRTPVSPASVEADTTSP